LDQDLCCFTCEEGPDPADVVDSISTRSGHRGDVGVAAQADKSKRMSTDERDKPLASWRDSVTVSRAVSVEYVALNPD